MAITELAKQTVGNDQELAVIDSGQECPDCHDTMTQFYEENDLPRFTCENCGYEILPQSRGIGDYHLGY